MSVPGSNILLTALTAIGSTSVNYFQNLGFVTNSAGNDLVTYQTPIAINSGSVQPIPKNRYALLGLDLQKSYFNWYVPLLNMIDLQRDTSGDVVETLDRRFQLISLTDWYGIDGWKQATLLDIGPATGNLTNA
jgi:hypothetical protein